MIREGALPVVAARSRGIRMLVAVAGLVALAGCGQTGMATDAGVEPLAKVEGWRGEPATADEPFGLVEVAFDDETATRAWDDNVPVGLPEGDGAGGEPGVYGSLEDLDSPRQALVVWHSGESSSCPGWLAGIDTDADGSVTIEREEHVGAGPCAADYHPYRMVVAVDRDLLPDPEQLPTDHVDIDGITDGRASAYPDPALAPTGDDP